MDRTDRERLEQVRSGQTTESRINEDFVDWLKGPGVTWLIVILLGVTAYLGIIQFRQSRDAKRSEAWAAFFSASLPESLVDVANQYGSIDGLAPLALRRAADMRLATVRLGIPLSSMVDPSESAAPELDDEERTRALQQAESLYQRVVDLDDGGEGFRLHAVHALAGLGAVEESRGRIEEAKRFYQRAAERAGDAFPILAKVFRNRIDAAGLDAPPAFPPRADVMAQRPALPARTPVFVDPALQRLIDGEGDAAPPAAP